MPGVTVGPCRVAASVQETADVRSFRLVRLGGIGPVPTPSCRLELLLGLGMVRHYSVLNGPSEKDGCWIGVKRGEPSRGRSRMLYETVEVGSTLDVAALRNNFPLRPTAAHHLFLAGGIGITPLLSMARAARRFQQFRVALLRQVVRGDGVPRCAAKRRLRPKRVRAGQARPCSGCRSAPPGGGGGAAGHALLYLRSGRSHRLRDGRGRAPAARRRDPSGGVHRGVADGCADGPAVCHKASAQRHGCSGAGRGFNRGGARRFGHRGAGQLRAGRVRHLRHHRAGRRAGPPRQLSDGSRASGR